MRLSLFSALFPALLLATLLGACSTLPSSGPTRNTVEDAASGKDGTLPFEIVRLDSSVLARLEHGTPPPGRARLVNLAAAGLPPRTDSIRVGDKLALTIYEVGVTLFSPQPGTPVSGSSTPAANERILAATVREDGSIEVPYLGRFNASGQYPEDLAATIRSRLQRISQSPDVSVAITESVANVAYVQGAVARPGRYPLTPARETLLDLIAVAGGTTVPAGDIRVKFVRGDFSAAVRLDEIAMEDLSNVVLLPGDRIELQPAARTFTVFGATDGVNEIPFAARDLTLAEAIAKGGGPSDGRADPRAVFLFRLPQQSGEGQDAPPDPAAPIAPIVYEIDMMRPDTYLVAQMVRMQDNDVLVFAKARSNVTAKLIAVLNQLFSPIFTGIAVSNSVK